MATNLAKQCDEAMARARATGEVLGREPHPERGGKICHVQCGNYDFRSRSEAKWAVFFDAAGIDFVYEPEGYNDKEGWAYLPDFYLPDLNMVVEVKLSEKELDDESRDELVRFMTTHDKKVMVGYGNMNFQLCYVKYGKLELTPRDNSFLAMCESCGHLWFGHLLDKESTKCSACGHPYSAAVLWGHFPLFLKDAMVDQRFLRAVKKALSARFEHGEKTELNNPKPKEEEEQLTV